MNGKNMSRQDDLEELRRRLAAREKERTRAVDKKRKDLEELRRRMETRAARPEGRAVADSNVEELRRRLAARRDAEARGIKYDDGRGNRHDGYRERRHGSRRNHDPSPAYAYAYRCVPVLACLLVFAISLGMFRTAASGSAVGVRDDRYAAIRAQWLAENVVDVKDPTAEPEASPFREPEDRTTDAGPAPFREPGDMMSDAGPVWTLAESGPVQGPMPVHGSGYEERTEEGFAQEEQAVVQPERDEEPAVQAQEQEKQERKKRNKDAERRPAHTEAGSTASTEDAPREDTDAGVLQVDGMMFPQATAPGTVGEVVFPMDELAVLPVTVPGPETDVVIPMNETSVLPATVPSPVDQAAYPADGTVFRPAAAPGPADQDMRILGLAA